MDKLTQVFRQKIPKELHCNLFGLPIAEKDGTRYCPRKELNSYLRKRKITKLFNKFYGIQTQFEDGPYFHDVEAVMVRIYSGRRTGTQLIWD